MASHVTWLHARSESQLLLCLAILCSFLAAVAVAGAAREPEHVGHDPLFEHKVPRGARRLIEEEKYATHEDLKLVENGTWVPRRDLLAGRRGAGFWSTRGNKFIDRAGRVVYFSGLIWTGFETPEAVVHGLWARSYQDHLDQMVRLGFNALRLPFAGDTLLPTTMPQGINYGLNPALQGLNSLKVMDRIIYAATLRGIKVILCYHRLHLTVANELGLWYDYYTPESTWINNWVMLAKRHALNPGVIGADLFNEVHDDKSFPKGAPYWAADGLYEGVRPYNYRTAVKRCMNAIQRVNKNWILTVEGMWNDYWWGGNVAKLMNPPINSNVKGKLAYSAHEYGPYIYMQKWFLDPTFPNNLPTKFYQMWGSVIFKNTAPVWVGEFGTFLPQTNSDKDVRERKCFYTLRDYIRLMRASWTYFQWGPDSKDTGGILQDDWRTPHVGKLQALRPIMHPNFGPSIGQKW